MVLNASDHTTCRLKWRLQRAKLDTMSPVNPLKIDQETITNQWFIGALVATILWVAFVLILLVMRKRIQLVSVVLKITLKRS